MHTLFSNVESVAEIR